jgi:uncharacterized protein (TIGR03790 family)
MPTRSLISLAAVCLLAHAAAGAAPLAPVTPHPEAGQTLVLANAAVPEGVEVARHYLAVRGIPAENLCVVQAPAGETVTRDEFNETIRGPLRSFLTRWEGRLDVLLPDGPVNLRVADRQAKYLVPVYGVPIKVGGYEDVATMYMSHAAAVDSELALLPGGEYKLVGPLSNPYFGATGPVGPPLAGSVLLVSRLDGPSAAVARRLVDDAAWADANGLKGRAYVDTRGLTKGPYLQGDQWLLRAAGALRAAGLQVEVDTRPEVLPLAHPMPDPAVYLGWYTDQAVGPMTATDFVFNRGAVAYHLQSFTGAAIRDPKSHWVGPLLMHGACVTAGAVYEPFLSGTPRVDVLIDRLVRGHSWGEAAYMAQPALSWQMCFIGDPLYRPFRRR